MLVEALNHRTAGIQSFPKPGLESHLQRIVLRCFKATDLVHMHIRGRGGSLGNYWTKILKFKNKHTVFRVKITRTDSAPSCHSLSAARQPHQSGVSQKIHFITDELLGACM